MKFHAEPSSGHPYDFDDRESNTGGSPVETVLAALASCSAMDVASIVSKKRQDVSSYSIEVTGDQRDEYPQVFGEITVVHELEGSNLSEAAIRRAIELSATKYCPVNAWRSSLRVEWRGAGDRTVPPRRRDRVADCFGARRRIPADRESDMHVVHGSLPGSRHHRMNVGLPHSRGPRPQHPKPIPD
jgi:putative redox protein